MKRPLTPAMSQIPHHATHRCPTLLGGSSLGAWTELLLLPPLASSTTADRSATPASGSPDVWWGQACLEMGWLVSPQWLGRETEAGRRVAELQPPGAWGRGDQGVETQVQRPPCLLAPPWWPHFMSLGICQPQRASWPWGQAWVECWGHTQTFPRFGDAPVM